MRGGPRASAEAALLAGRTVRGALDVTVDRQRPKLELQAQTTLCETTCRRNFRRSTPASGDAATALLARDGVSADALPATCPYTLEQMLDVDWYPVNVHGIEIRLPEA